MKHVALPEVCIKIIKAADKCIPPAPTPRSYSHELIFLLLSLDYPLKSPASDCKSPKPVGTALFAFADRICLLVIEQCRAIKWTHSIHHSYILSFIHYNLPLHHPHYPTSHTHVLALPSTVFLPTHLLPWLQ